MKAKARAITPAEERVVSDAIRKVHQCSVWRRCETLTGHCGDMRLCNAVRALERERAKRSKK